jgi:hypothetical protein
MITSETLYYILLAVSAVCGFSVGFCLGIVVGKLDN